MSRYFYYCFECHKEFTINLDFEPESMFDYPFQHGITVDCPFCGREAKFQGQPAPLAAGVSDGPGGRYQPTFDKPDPYNDTLRTLKNMEAAGKLKDQATLKAAQVKLKKLKEQEPLRKKVDYQKTGHPLYG